MARGSQKPQTEEKGLFNWFRTFFKKIAQWFARFLDKKPPPSESKQEDELRKQDAEPLQKSASSSTLTPIALQPAPKKAEDEESIEERLFQLEHRQNMTRLMDAVNKNDIEAVKKFLQNPFNINKVNTLAPLKGIPDTALGLAVQSGNLEMIALLLEKGASTQLSQYYEESYKLTAESTRSVFDFFPDTLEGLSVEQYQTRKIEVFKLIADKGKVVTLHDNKLFQTVLSLGHIATLKNTLNFMQENQVKGEYNPYSFDRALSPHAVSFYEFFYKRIELKSPYFSVYKNDKMFSHAEHNAIEFAMKNQQEEAALFLLQSVIEKTKDGTLKQSQIETLSSRLKRTLCDALVFAIYYGQNRVIEFCLQNLELEEISNYFNNNNGLTALMAAAYTGNIELIDRLLDIGVDINHANDGRFYMETDKNHTALYAAIISDKNTDHKHEIVTLLLNNGAKLNSIALHALAKMQFEINFHSITVPIAFLEEADYDKSHYQDILDKIQAHNDGVNLKLMTALDSNIKDIPSPITQLFVEYLGAGKAVQERDSETLNPESDTPTVNKPKSGI